MTQEASDPAPTQPRDCLTDAEFSDYLSGWLDEGAHAVADDHIDQCETCRQNIEKRGAYSGAFDSSLYDELIREVGVTSAGLWNPPTPFAVVSTNQSGNAIPPGTAIGPYRLLEPLGSGGMGTVYRATHTRLNRDVALKVLQGRRWHSAEAVARFEREMQLVGQLAHPNIVTATDAGEHGGVHFLAMEIVDGIDLSALARQVGPLAMGTACELIRQAAIGLQFAHERGIVHRDIKPSNLMLARPAPADSSTGLAVPLVRILDFGLAQSSTTASGSDELTTTGQIMGTVDYMAPEQAEDTRTADTRSDIYSLGATLFKLLTGQSPLTAPADASPLKKIAALASGSTTQISKVRSDLPAALVTLLDRMLSHAPAERPTSMAEIAEVLSRFADGSQVLSLLSGVTRTADENRPADSVRQTSSPSIRLADGLPVRRPAELSSTARRVVPGHRSARLRNTAVAVAGCVALLLLVSRPWQSDQESSGESVPTVDLDGQPAGDTAGPVVSVSSDADSAGDHDLVQQPQSVASPPLAIRDSLSTSDSVPVDLGVVPERGAWMSPDGRRIYFSKQNPAGSRGQFDIYVAHRSSDAGPFADVERMENINTTNPEQFPALSPDELTIVFSTRHPGSPQEVGGMDILWSSRESIDQPFSPPRIYRPEINSEANEHSPFLSTDGTELFFASARENGPYAYELWVAHAKSVPDGHDLNFNAEQFASAATATVTRCLSSRFMDSFAPCLSHDRQHLWFQSSSELSPGKFALYMATRSGDGSFADIVRVTDATEPEPRRNEDNPWLSPDGRTLFFTAASDDVPRHVRALALEEGVEVTPQPSMPKNPADIVTIEGAAEVDLGVIPTAGAHFSRDGLRLYFSAPRSDTDSSGDLFVATRDSIDVPFETIKPLTEFNSPNVHDAEPTLSADELTIIFNTQRNRSFDPTLPPGSGADLWMATRASIDQPFGKPAQLSEPVNSMNADRWPHLSVDGLELFFASNRDGGAAVHQFGIYRATRSDVTEPFANVVALAHPKGKMEAPCLSHDGLQIWFQSFGHVAGGHRLFHGSRLSRSEPFADFREMTAPRRPWQARSPWLSHDGQLLYFYSNNGPDLERIRRMPIP